MKAMRVNQSYEENAAFLGGMKDDLANLKEVVGDEIKTLQFAVAGLEEKVLNGDMHRLQHGESMRTRWEDQRGCEPNIGEELESELQTICGLGDKRMKTCEQVKGSRTKAPCTMFKGTWTSTCLTIHHDIGDWTKALYCVGPYKVSKQPSLTTMKVADYMFDEKLDKKECLIRIGPRKLYRESVRTLAPGRKPDYEVMPIYIENKVMCLRTSSEKKQGCLRSMEKEKNLVCILPTSYTEAIIDARVDVAEFVGQNKMKEVYMHRWDQCAKVIVPVEDKEAEQWFVMVVNLQKGGAELWDVRGGEQSMLRRRQKCRILLRSLDKWLIQEHGGLEGVRLNSFASLEIVYRGDIAKENDAIDGFDFVLRCICNAGNMEAVSFEVDVESERLGMLMELFLSAHNEEMIKILQAAMYNDGRRHVRTALPPAIGSKYSRTRKEIPKCLGGRN